MGAIFPPIQIPPDFLFGTPLISVPKNHNKEFVADFLEDPVPTTSPTKALTAKEEAAEKKKILIRRQAERILEVQEAEEEKEYTREIELKFRHKFHKKWDNVVKNLSLGETLEVFGVEVKDKKSTNELRKAYRKALMKFHPDRLARGSVSLQDKVNGEEIFKIINGKMENS